MIKEIMLASALSFAHPQVNLNLVGQPIDIYFYDITYPDLLINLDSGYISNGNIYYSSDDGYYVSENLNSYGRTNFYYFMDFIQSGLIEMGFNYDSDFDECSLIADFDLYYLDVDYSEFFYDDRNEIYLNCQLLTDGEDNNTFIQIGENFDWIINNTQSYFTIDYLDSNILNDNIYLNIDLGSSTTSTGDTLSYYSFEGFSCFLQYQSFHVEDSIGDSNFDYLSFSDYIYNDFNRLIGDYETLDYEYKMLMHEASQLVDSNQQLQSEKAELIKEKDELNSINQNLRQENQNLRQENEILKAEGITNFTFGKAIKTISENASALLETEILPNFTIGNIIFIPVIFSLIGIIFKFFRR